MWNGVKCLVTGGAGFIGSHLAKTLLQRGAEVKIVDNLDRGRLENLASILDQIEMVKADLTRFETCLEAVKGTDVVFHLAAKLGGVEYMTANQADVYTPNVLMNTFMLEAARRSNVEKYEFTSTACVYPYERQLEEDCPPLKEEEAYPAHPESTYGWAKLMGELQCQSYAQDYGTKIVIIRMFNVYGENEDLSIERSHVIPSLIRKAIRYPREPFRVFGNGEQTRAFLYVSDAVEGILRSIEKCDEVNPHPVNIGSDKRVKIRELADMIIDTSNKDIEAIYDESKPTGVYGRAADYSVAQKRFGWKPKVPLKEGLKKTYAWAEKELMKRNS